MELPISRLSSPTFLTSPEDNTPGQHVEMNTHSISSNVTSSSSSQLTVSMPQFDPFDEACLVALEAAMTKKKETTAYVEDINDSVDKMLDISEIDNVSRTVPVTPSASLGTDSFVHEGDYIDKNDKVEESEAEAIPAQNDLVVDLSDDEEMELDFDTVS